MSKYEILNILSHYDSLTDSMAYKLEYMQDSAVQYLNLSIPYYEIYKSNSSFQDVLLLNLEQINHNLSLAVKSHLYANGPTTDSWEIVGYKTTPIFEKEFVLQDAKTYYNNAAEYIAVNYKPIAPLNSTVSTTSSVSGSVNSLPGLNEEVHHPKLLEWDCYADCLMSGSTLRDMIMHLNDAHRWTRESIADWLDTLDLDLRFKTQDDKLREEKDKKVVNLKHKIQGLTESIAIWKKSIEEANESISALEAELETLQQEVTNEQD